MTFKNTNMEVYDREIWHERAKIMEAFASGKEIECRTLSPSSKRWLPISQPSFNFNKYEYRLKPEYRPYLDLKEFCEAVAEKGNYIEVQHIFDNADEWRLHKITAVYDYEISLQGDTLTFSDLLKGIRDKKFRWPGGSPCGTPITDNTKCDANPT